MFQFIDRTPVSRLPSCWKSEGDRSVFRRHSEAYNVQGRRLTEVFATASLASITNGTVCNVAVRGIRDLDVLVAVPAVVNGF